MNPQSRCEFQVDRTGAILISKSFIFENFCVPTASLKQPIFHLKAEQDKKIKNRKDAQAIAGFNLKVAEELKAQKDVRDGSFERSYVFKNRPVTPPHYVRQEDYADDLYQQVCIFCF